MKLILTSPSLFSGKRVVTKTKSHFHEEIMNTPRRNFITGYQIVKQNFQRSAADLFEKQHHGTICNNAFFINVLFCALCRTQSLFAMQNSLCINKKYDWAEAETDGCSLECGQAQRNGGALFRSLLRPLAKILDASKLKETLPTKL